jgi:hypothetical protein
MMMRRDASTADRKITHTQMKTVNSLSGGKTSSYMAANYPADYNIFSLVRTNDKSCIFPDENIRKIISEKIGVEFIGTLEMDDIIYTMLDLEQFIGSEITWVTGDAFEDVIDKKSMYLPNIMTRFCTTKMKTDPIFHYLKKHTELPVEMRIGFRANEMDRASRMLAKAGEDGVETYKATIQKRKDGKNKWEVFPYRYAKFPLIEHNIHKDNVEEYWKDKPVRFAYMNNCIGCFHRNPMLLKHMSAKCPEKFDWFIKQEDRTGNQFKSELSYAQIKKHRLQIDLFDDDFNSCDSGSCGL